MSRADARVSEHRWANVCLRNLKDDPDVPHPLFRHEGHPPVHGGSANFQGNSSLQLITAGGVGSVHWVAWKII